MFPLVSLPAGDAEGCPPAVLPPGWRSIYQARQRSANVVLILAKAAPQASTWCHMQCIDIAIMDTWCTRHDGEV